MRVAWCAGVCIGVLGTRALGRTLARVLVVVRRVRVVVTGVRVKLVGHATVHLRCATEMLRVLRVLHLGHVRLRGRLSWAVPAAVVLAAVRTLRELLGHARCARSLVRHLPEVLSGRRHVLGVRALRVLLTTAAAALGNKVRAVHVAVGGLRRGPALVAGLSSGVERALTLVRRVATHAAKVQAIALRD